MNAAEIAAGQRSRDVQRRQHCWLDCNADAPVMEQAKEVAEYIASKFVPISVGNFTKGQQHHESALQQVGHFFGINSAPATVVRSAFQDYVMSGGAKGWGDFTKTPEEAHRKQVMRAASAALRRGDEPDYSGLTDDDIEKAQQDSDHPVPQLLFRYLTNPDKIKAYELATPAERQRYQLHDAIENMDLEKSAPFKRLVPAEQDKLRKQLKAIRSGN
ncbi:MAG: hypothetical protein QM741_17045 [Rudaea sp.]|uniref:hypothetical protein n=1 Tax=Rudaea sp. TaxID=2136325 RepID=UPI0039E2B1C3